MLLLSWQITLLAVASSPSSCCPRRWAGRRLSGLTREQMQINAQLSASMTERFNVGGAMLVKLFGRPAAEQRRASTPAPPRCATSASRSRWSAASSTARSTLVAALATALVYGVGGHLAISGAVSSETWWRWRR